MYSYETRMEWISFIASIGVERFDRPLENPWNDGISIAKEEGNHILLLDPTEPSIYTGLKISKDVAEKFLVLGIP